MLVKKGRFYFYYLDNEIVTLNISNWETPFGLESFGKKTIINLKVPESNEGKNLLNTLEHISNDILSETGEYAKLPLKDNVNYKLLRCELIDNRIIEKNDKISGELNFRIYNFKGNWGVSIIL